MDWSSMFDSRVVVFGCGNTLYGDDGLGPLAIKALQDRGDVGQDVACIDAGTSIRPLIFDLILSDNHPQRVIIIDSTTDEDMEPGEVREIDISRVDPKKISDFSMHQFPTTNLLKELQETTEIKLSIIVVRAAHIPEKMQEGLSPEVQKALEEVQTKVLQLVNSEVQKL
ncbi:hydrogenase maturation protease [Desulfonatronospira sp. MSAO_Bac3]|uniref:hydrogenase maturation protease n=1 Tax=Desulfonatronospira sp. MSAO_Bac3 TaxID=2293857 RepID=UPI000FEF6E8F|nr:hydrogenase maturation protease [Desulfonatronospira sp. MSAO_Bac3]RQD75193.1 MAG: hydrogenase maturation protease [Desulfonatronospira sp. MSAO_Bac3]